MKHPPQTNPLHELRERAEHALTLSSPPESSDGPETLMRELQIHQLELQMQNEALREAHYELAKSRERYQELFERAPLAYLVLDSNSRVTESNHAACALLQMPASELRGKKLSKFIEAPYVHRFAQHLRATLAADGMQQCEVNLVLPDGRLRSVRLESARAELQSGRWRTAIVDLTELRQLQRQLERAGRLEAVGGFASGIAHDFANLLAVVSGAADLALELVEPSAQVRLPIERAKRATLQGKAMIHRLLRFAAGPESDSTAVFELDAAVRGAEQAIRQLAGPTVKLDLQLHAGDALVCLDLGGPEEVLLNLAANAHHAMPRGGTLKIETRVVDSHVALDPRLPPQCYALLSVSDDGIGMDTQTQTRAFEPFFTTKSAGHGTGLGLSMVYGIVKRAGGHIQLSSELGKGTTFRLFLPLASGRSAA